MATLVEIQRGFAEDQVTLAPREDSRIAADLDCHSEAPKNHEVVGNSAFFSRSEKATFENRKLDSMSQVSDPKESDAVAHNPNFKS